MKYSSTVRPSRNEDLIGRGMNSPFGLVTRPFMPASVRGLGEVTRRARLDDRDDRVVLRVVLPQRLTDLFGRLLPDLDQLAVALVVVQSTALVLLFDPVGFLLVAVEDLLLFGGTSTSAIDTVTPERVAQ